MFNKARQCGILQSKKVLLNKQLTFTNKIQSIFDNINVTKKNK